MHDKTLDGQVAIITGAGRGIGRALALGYAQAGAAVACVARSRNEIEQVAAEIAAAGGQAAAIVVDVAVLENVEQMVKQVVEIFGRIDILVINAGISMPQTPLADSDPDQWRQVIEVNLIGAYHCAHAVVPQLKAAGGGKIITIGSGLGHRGTANGSAYAASKAALWSMTRVLAQELYEHNISVNELVPGPVYTGMTPRSDGKSLGASEWYKDPDDVVPLALFLATQPNNGPTAQSYSLMRRDA